MKKISIAECRQCRRVWVGVHFRNQEDADNFICGDCMKQAREADRG